MKHDAVREAVRDRYGRIAEEADEAKESCCGPSCCGGISGTSTSAAVGYSDEQLGQIPEGADLGLGSRNPVSHAALQEGETVLDLGSGGGIDSFLASEKVGPSGKVIGVDMTPEDRRRLRGRQRHERRKAEPADPGGLPGVRRGGPCSPTVHTHRHSLDQTQSGSLGRVARDAGLERRHRGVRTGGRSRRLRGYRYSHARGGRSADSRALRQ